MRQGLIQIYTGDGKGKTTAAVGLAVRARGHNFKVGYIFFFKDPKKFGYAEIRLLKKLGVKVFGFSHKHPHFYKNLGSNSVRRECLKGMNFIKKICHAGSYDLLILDEILIALRDGFLSENEILEIMTLKPPDMELVMTGRGATGNIIKKADLVSVIEKKKHYLDKGVTKRKGIEF
ncbi:MAG: cob(I)yrinic acid a,c-diamide adenosyltransferase [Candidatus Omnitrophota bacterium]|nr:cob(I)yrinic acid a,c-diamide adenosyltransferase [Candidatus Omnitrophota bacterium]